MKLTEFARMADPIKHYLIDKVGMDELSAGMMAGSIVEAQRETFEALIAERLRAELGAGK